MAKYSNNFIGPKRRRGNPGGPRMGVRQFPDPVEHHQYYAFLRNRAQAKFRNEIFELSFTDFKALWGDNWHRRGRGGNDMILTKIDTDQSWNPINCCLMTRQEHLKRAGEMRTANRRHH